MAERSNIEVAVRVRPILPFEDEECWLVNPKAHSITSMVSSKIASKYGQDRNTTKLNIQKQLNKFSFEYDFIADDSVKSETIYKQKCSKIVSEALCGVNGTICTYGQTCSGKTYTMLGVPQSPGILPCALRNIFKTVSADNEWQYSIQIAYLEIYNEQLIDLLNPKGDGYKLQEDSIWGIDIKHLHKVRVYTFNEAIEVLEKGESNRSYRKKDNHDRSSRSHTVFRLYLQSNNMELSKQKLIRRHSLLNLVDLAGSERLTDSKHDNSTETGSINKSLFLLSNVISKLAEGEKQHIPYRDSKLTRLLQNSLGGNSCTLIVCCVSPAIVNFQQTLSTLRFGMRAKKVVNQKQENFQEGEIARLQRQLEKQRDDYIALERKYNNLQSQMQQLRHKLQSTSQENSNPNTQQVPSVLVRYDMACFVDEDGLEVMLKAQSAYLDMSALEKLLVSKQYRTIKADFVQSLHELYRHYCDQTIRYLADTYLKSLKSSELSLLLELNRQSFINLKWMSESTGHAYQNQERLHLLKVLTQEKLKHLKQMQANNKVDKIMATKVIEKYNNFIVSLPKQITHANSFILVKDVPLQLKCRNNKLLMWGSNKDGRLGHNNTNSTSIYEIPQLRFSAVSLGSHHSVALTSSGQVYGWGRNSSAQLGENSEVIAIPTLISMKSKIIQVAAGWGHTLLLDSEGAPYSFGYNENGQLGHNNRQPVLKPTKIAVAPNIIHIYAGHSHSAFIDKNDNFYTFGCNVDCRLMLSSEEDKDVLTPTKNSLRGVVSASLGVCHTCVITRDGKLFAGGDGTFGQLGCRLTENIAGVIFTNPITRKYEDEKVEKHCPVVEVEFFDERKRPVRVACGESFTVVLDQNNMVYSFGKGAYHRLGVDTLNNVYEPILIKELNNKEIVKIAAGCRHVLCLTEAGQVYSWGFNLYNQIGVPTEQDVKTPILVNKLNLKVIQDISCGFFHSACLESEVC